MIKTEAGTGSNGLQHRTAWAGAGDGVLFIEADGNGVLSNSPEYVFAEWAGGAADDLDALRKVFDSNGDGKLTSADARWSEFRVLVSQADGSKVTRTLAELGITEINLTTRSNGADSASRIVNWSKKRINDFARQVLPTLPLEKLCGMIILDYFWTSMPISTIFSLCSLPRMVYSSFGK